MAHGGIATAVSSPLFDPSLINPAAAASRLAQWIRHLIRQLRQLWREIRQAAQENSRELIRQVRLTWVVLKSEFRYIHNYWQPYYRPGALIVAGLLLYKSLRILVAYGLKMVVDGVTAAQSIGLLPILGASLLVAFPLVFFINLGTERLLARVSSNIAHDLRSDMFRQLQALSYVFFNDAQPGDISARFASDSNIMIEAIGQRFVNVVANLFGLLLTVPILFYLQWQLAILVFLLLPLVLLVTGARGNKLVETTYELKQAEGMIGDLVQESVHIQPVLKSFAAEAVVTERFDNQLVPLTEKRFEALFQLGVLRLSATQFLLFTEVVTAVVGGAWVLAGSMTAGSLVAFLALLDMIQHELSDVVKWNIPYFIYAVGAGKRLDDILTEAPIAEDIPGAPPLPPFRETIHFDRVSFSYARQRGHLEQVTLTIRAGQHVAIVGPNGAGKSTLISLLMRFFEPDEGRILIDEQDIRHVTLASLRQQMSIVFQDPLLYHATIRENICIARPTATAEAMVAAAQQADIHDFITTLPQGYQTVVGEGGSALSGGQRQKIAIARSLLRDPAILILDEVTRGLDRQAQTAVQATIAANVANRTVMTITHDLQSLAAVDQIFVMDDGRLVEQGTHQQLLARDGMYTQLWRTVSPSEN